MDELEMAAAGVVTTDERESYIVLVKKKKMRTAPGVSQPIGIDPM